MNMFKKPVKVKSNTQVKGSERKTFKDLLLKSFPTLMETEVNEFLPKKETLNSLKIVTHDETVVQVYTVQKRAMIFIIKGRIFPTVFFLWKFPNVLYNFTTHRQVMNYISSGADLMLPGIVTPPPQTNLPKFGNVSETDIVGVNLSNNSAAIAVGVASQNSASMMLANSRGKCVIIYHFHGDNLCTLEGMANLTLPNFGPPEWLKLKSYEEDFPKLGTKPRKPSGDDIATKDDEKPCCSSSSDTIPVKEDEISDTEDSATDVDPLESSFEEDMDELLYYCFFGAIKYSKPLPLPMLTSNFFKFHMLRFVPENKTLNLKKTSFKKLKPFLEQMVTDRVITLAEIQKGVDAVIHINKGSPKYLEFYIGRANRPSSSTSSDKDGTQATGVVESYIITQNVLPIFQPGGYRKHDIVQLPEIRKCVTKYIKENNLQDDFNSRLVNPQDLLATICKTRDPLNWEEVMENVCDSLKNCYKITTATEEIINKGKLPPICMSISVRSGNKKVTLVDNLESYGIRLADFAKECQHGVAASTSINPLPGRKSAQLLVQGNQIEFIHNLLTDKYKIPKKHIKGLENAPKKKK